MIKPHLLTCNVLHKAHSQTTNELRYVDAVQLLHGLKQRRKCCNPK